MNNHETQPDTLESGVMTKSRRRLLVGAGASAAPFLLTLVSQPALGTTCFTPSRSLSRNTSLSQTGKYGECTGAESPGNYAAQQTSGTSPYHWPASVSPTTPMHTFSGGVFAMGNSEGVTKFTKVVGSNIVSKTLGEALNVNASGQVHFHVIAAYLNKLGGNGAVIPDTVMTVSSILGIWSEYASKGYYQPFAGTKWYATDIVGYLISNGIVK